MYFNSIACGHQNKKKTHGDYKLQKMQENIHLP